MSILLPFGVLYGWIISLRNYFYDRGIFRAHDLGARTISVGNLTTGGTGKTPLVSLIAEILVENGEKVCILTRGYGRRNEDERVLVSDGDLVLADADNGGDEPVELAHKLIGKAIIIADENRVAAAKWATDKFKITAFILDDGYQHRQALRDLDIVCIDATNPCGNGRMIPAGTLREPLRDLDRADAIVITRVNAARDVDEIINRLRTLNCHAPIFCAMTHVLDIAPISGMEEGERFRPDDLKGKRVFAFCGIGNPEAFFELFRDLPSDIRGTMQFRDHHCYTQEDIDAVEKKAAAADAEVLVTTGKDAVKLSKIQFSMPCLKLEIGTQVTNSDRFRELIISAL